MAIDVRDGADQAQAHEEFDTALALLRLRQQAGLKPKGGRLVNKFCDECGAEIDPASRAAETATDILLCIDCQRASERFANHYGPG